MLPHRATRRLAWASPSHAVSPSRKGIYWGWWIVIGAVVGQFVAMGSTGAVAGVFLRPMTEDLAWTSAEYTLGGASAVVVGGLAGFIIGPLVDRYGAKPLMLIGACVYLASFFAMSRVETLWQFIVLSMVAGGAGFSHGGTAGRKRDPIQVVRA